MANEIEEGIFCCVIVIVVIIIIVVLVAKGNSGSTTTTTPAATSTTAPAATSTAPPFISTTAPPSTTAPTTTTVPPTTTAAPVTYVPYFQQNGIGYWDPNGPNQYTCPQTTVNSWCIVNSLPTAYQICANDPNCVAVLKGNGSTIQLTNSTPVVNSGAAGTWYKKTSVNKANAVMDPTGTYAT